MARGNVKRIYPAGFTKVSSLGVEQQRVKVVVAIGAEDLERLRTQQRLGVGYRVRVKIYTAEKPEARIIPRSALFRSVAGHWQVYAVRAGKAVLQQVEVGLMNDEQVEVLKGLSPEDRVILAPETTLSDGTWVKDSSQ